MRLVSRRSDLRCLVMTPIYIGFGYVALARAAPPLLRFGSAVIALIAGYALVQYLCCVRRWRRVGNRLEIPTLRDRGRHIIVEEGTELNVVDYGFSKMLHIGQPFKEGTRQLAMNLFVSGRDLRRWVA